MIPIEVRSKTVGMEILIRQFAERRISFALDHLRNLRRIAISIEDVNGPKGGADKHCRIVAELGFTSVVLDETQPDWQSAVARAIHRLDRKATHELQRVNGSGLRSAHRSHRRTSRKTQVESNDDPGSKLNTRTD
jgi:putative sigma-54 modulation protein